MRLLIVALALLIPGQAVASAVLKGATEIVASGSISHTAYSTGDLTATSLRFSGGYLRAVTDFVQLGGAFGLRYEAADAGSLGETDGGSFGVEGLVRLNFGSSPTTIPYLQGGVGVAKWTGDFDPDGPTWLLPELTLGMRFLLHELASFNISISWLHEINAFGADNLDANTFVLGFGFSIFPSGVDGKR